MRISDWSSDVCSSDLGAELAFDHPPDLRGRLRGHRVEQPAELSRQEPREQARARRDQLPELHIGRAEVCEAAPQRHCHGSWGLPARPDHDGAAAAAHRSEEHTSELQSLMRSSSAVFCLKKKTINNIIKQ